MKGDAYVPVYSEASDAWYPSNRAADLLVHLNHIWSDIQTLNKLWLQGQPESKVTEKLLFKYAVIEFLSLFDPLSELLKIAINSPHLVKGQPPPWRYITKRELIETKRLAKEFWRGVAPVQQELTEIRNNIGAHRRFLDLGSIQILWKRLDVKQYMTVMNAFPPLFEHLSHLNIFDWGRSLGEQDGNIVMSMFGARIVHDWEDAFDTENETI
jgi:hypothetical protein